MTVTKLWAPALAAALLAPVTACGASSAPGAPASTATASRPAVTRHSANSAPVTATMPDVIGGNAGRAREQMRSGLEMTFKDVSGRGRPVDHLALWKICTSQPGPNQRITGHPVVFGVVRVLESCEDAVAG
ncbi:hypothetical protein ACIQVT_19570 [Streptomyces sp. NPDC100445]|uniref:hypothetical protein n=1 Tax=Streptomyces sp. NPDC100445 TaxID=3366102 RepID=UPI0038291996